MRTGTLLGALALLATGCVAEVGVEDTERLRTLAAYDGPTLEFDPGAGVIPIPNNLLRDVNTGRVNLQPACNESESASALREGVLNALDGFGTFKAPLRLSVTAPPDIESFKTRIRLFDVTRGREVPVAAVVTTIHRASADCTSSQSVDGVAVLPHGFTKPLEGGHDYVVAVLNGAAAQDGQPYLPSPVWDLVRQANNPVGFDAQGVVVRNQTALDPADPDDLETLRGIDKLWRAHAKPLAFLDQVLAVPRSDIVLAWSFSTQTVTGPLDPSIPGSLAERLPGRPLMGIGTRRPEGISILDYLTGVLGSAEACTALGCQAVRDVLGGWLVAPQYRVESDNPVGDKPLPGPWSDPIWPEWVSDEKIDVLAFTPKSPMPVRGYPVIIFGHGLAGSSSNLFTIASQLAAAGFASVSIPWPNHASRAVQFRDDSDAGCDSEELNPSAAAQCFVPIVSSNLAATRDALRQAALDAMTLAKALKACGTAGCRGLPVDGSRIGYLGMSLGSIIGSVVVSQSREIKAAVLNVGGVGLVDIIENTANLGLRCSIVDALIAAGTIEGAPFDPVAGTGTCVGESWREDPGWQPFAGVARWVLDPSDGVNYLAGMAPKPVLVQEVINDEVVPNVVTEQLAGLLGLLPSAAAVFDGTSEGPQPSEPLRSDEGGSTWLTYDDVPAELTLGMIGNKYAHGSLLQPAELCGEGALCAKDDFEQPSCMLPQSEGCTDCPEGTGCAKDAFGNVGCRTLLSAETCLGGQLGTAQMQTDVVHFFSRQLAY